MIVGESRSRVRREPLEVTDDQDDLTTIILCQRCNDETLILPATHRRYEAFLLQTMQRASHGRSTQSQSLGDRSLGDACAGWEMSPHD